MQRRQTSNLCAGILLLVTACASGRQIQRVQDFPAAMAILTEWRNALRQ